MNDVLMMCRHFPQLVLQPGDRLIEETLRTDRLYVLVRGSFVVSRGGVQVTRISEPGAFLGEMSTVLESASTATVLAIEESVVYVIDQATAVVHQWPELTLAIAQILARRLSALTAYVVDIKQQYAGSDTHLAVMDQVLTSLSAAAPGETRVGSERSDVPDY